MDDPKVADISDGELSPATSQVEGENTDTNTMSRTTTSSSHRSVKSSKSSKKKKSRYDLLDEKWTEKFEKYDKAIDAKLDGFFDRVASRWEQTQSRSSQPEKQSQRRFSTNEESQRPSTSENVSQRHMRDNHSDSEHSEIESDNEDRISLHVGRKETLPIYSDDDDLQSIDDNISISDKTKKCLFELFGNDAVTKKSDKKQGIKLDDSQKEVLLGSWRAENPNIVTAFAEENRCFSGR